MKRVLREYRNKTTTSSTPPDERELDADPIVDLKIKERNANENIWSSGERGLGRKCGIYGNLIHWGSSTLLGK